MVQRLYRMRQKQNLMKMTSYPPAQCRPAAASVRPAMNVREENQTIELQFVIPGFRRDDITIQVEDQHLIIKGEPGKEEINGYVRREFRPAAFEKRFKLSDRVAQDAIEARVEDGILFVTVGLIEPVRREIAVA